MKSRYEWGWLLTKRQQPRSDLRLSYLYIYGIDSFFAIFRVESDDIAFTDVVDQSSRVYENLLLGAIIDDESEAFGLIEKLNSSCTH